ncbi:MAG TPA: hypothetical protein VGG39_18395 [Polyangiaceae bacterium]|jgi:hypothetical protein
MATDKSEPRVGIIAQVAIIAIVTLFAVRAVLTAYFDHMARAEEARKVAVPEVLHAVRAEDDQKLKTGAMPIDVAMQTLAAKGRMSASPDIMPSSGAKDIAPLQGWVKLPNEVPAAMTAPPPPAPAASSAAPASSSVPPAGSATPAPIQKPKQP